LPLDYIAAYAWYSRALSSGDQSASDHLKSLSHVMTPKQINRAVVLLASLPPPSRAAATAVDPIETSIPPNSDALRE